MKGNTPTPSRKSEQRGGILVLESDEQLATAVLNALQEAAPAADVDIANSIEQAQQLVIEHRPDLFVLDVDATEDLGQEFLYDLRTSHPNARAIVLTGVHLTAHREQAVGLGAILSRETIPHRDFIDLVQALLSSSTALEREKFQGTLSDLHIADIIQLKCMSGSTSGLEFTGPSGEKARVYFEGGQVRHATAPNKEGVRAFNEIVNWKGGKISEVSGFAKVTPSIDLDWQILLMEAVRNIDETRGSETDAGGGNSARKGKVLVIDDSLMLLSFVREILAEAHYQVVTAPTAQEGLAAAVADCPDLILLDFLLPDIKGDEVSERFLSDPATSNVPVIYMSGFGSDLQPDLVRQPNVIGSLNKPFTSALLIKTVANYIPKQASALDGEIERPELPSESENLEVEGKNAAADSQHADFSVPVTDEPGIGVDSGNLDFPEMAEVPAEAAAGGASDAWWSAPAMSSSWSAPETPGTAAPSTLETQEEQFTSSAELATLSDLPFNGNAYFCGNTSFFSLNRALHTIEQHKLTGALRSFWTGETVELLARNGKVMFVTTRDPALYCPEAPIALVNIDAERVTAARDRQRESGCPLFLTLTDEGLILRESAHQLVQHYGQNLFAQLWTAPAVRFAFEKTEQLPDLRIRD